MLLFVFLVKSMLPAFGSIKEEKKEKRNFEYHLVSKELKELLEEAKKNANKMMLMQPNKLWKKSLSTVELISVYETAKRFIETEETKRDIASASGWCADKFFCFCRLFELYTIQHKYSVHENTNCQEMSTGLSSGTAKEWLEKGKALSDTINEFLFFIDEKQADQKKALLDLMLHFYQLGCEFSLNVKQLDWFEEKVVTFELFLAYVNEKHKAWLETEQEFSKQILRYQISLNLYYHQVYVTKGAFEKAIACNKATMKLVAQLYADSRITYGKLEDTEKGLLKDMGKEESRSILLRHEVILEIYILYLQCSEATREVIVSQQALIECLLKKLSNFVMQQRINAINKKVNENIKSSASMRKLLLSDAWTFFVLKVLYYLVQGVALHEAQEKAKEAFLQWATNQIKEFRLHAYLFKEWDRRYAHRYTQSRISFSFLEDKAAFCIDLGALEAKLQQSCSSKIKNR